MLTFFVSKLWTKTNIHKKPNSAADVCFFLKIEEKLRKWFTRQKWGKTYWMKMAKLQKTKTDIGADDVKKDKRKGKDATVWKTKSSSWPNKGLTPQPFIWSCQWSILQSRGLPPHPQTLQLHENGTMKLLTMRWKQNRSRQICCKRQRQGQRQ